MLIVIARAPQPDAPHWPGRTGLAVIDAVAWPLFWIVLLRHVPVSTGTVGPVGCALAALGAIVRLQRALRMNHRYRFTTWRWGKVLASLLLVGEVLKLASGG